VSRTIKTLVGVVAAALLAAPAAGSTPPEPCPPGFEIFEHSPGDVFFDRNGDGFVCVKEVPGRGSSRDEPGFTVVDTLFFVVDS
jgi:plasmid stabilization system protein ParE